MQLGKIELDRRKIIDAVEAHVFEALSTVLFRAGSPVRNDELARFASRCLFHRAAPLSFLPGAMRAGMRISSRYFATCDA